MSWVWDFRIRDEKVSTCEICGNAWDPWKKPPPLPAAAEHAAKTGAADDDKEAVDEEEKDL